MVVVICLFTLFFISNILCNIALQRKDESVTNGQVSVVSTTVAGVEDSRLCSSYPQVGYRQSTFLSASLDNKTLNSYTDCDPLSLLADVAAMAPSTAGPSVSSAPEVGRAVGRHCL